MNLGEVDYYLPVLLAWIIVIALGAVVSLYAYRAYRTNRTRSMRFLASGLVLLSGAAGFTWLALWWSGMDPMVCELGSTGVSAAGFGSVLYSLRTRAP